MTYKTYAQLKALIQAEWDLEQEEFVDSDELLSYFNIAIREVESAIHKLDVAESYFRKKGSLSVTSGSTDVAPPSDIFANKILRLIYNDGSNYYEIKRLRGANIYLEIERELNVGNTGQRYRYLIRNDSSAGNKIQITPAPDFTNSTYVRCWYIRSATEMSADASTCDIPEFYNVILYYVAWRVLGKDGDPRAAAAKGAYETAKKEMMETLETMVEDGDTEIQPDLTHYEEMA